MRHTTEILHSLSRVLTQDGSIWWNVMDTFNTRTQIRGSAVEALRAMQGGENYKVWSEHEYRRYSAGHAYLKDGEQVGIPAMIAQRASRLGLFVKSTITWAKTATLPEPQKSRVSRQLEYVIHITKQRSPKFDKDAYSRLSAAMGGRNQLLETAKLSDVWVIPTSSGGGRARCAVPPSRSLLAASACRPTQVMLSWTPPLSVLERQLWRRLRWAGVESELTHPAPT